MNPRPQSANRAKCFSGKIPLIRFLPLNAWNETGCPTKFEKKKTIPSFFHDITSHHATNLLKKKTKTFPKKTPKNTTPPFFFGKNASGAPRVGTAPWFFHVVGPTTRRTDGAAAAAHDGGGRGLGRLGGATRNLGNLGVLLN